ncbi:glycosyltransferase family 39 protein [Patescibacteria group bacterium]|nr:MAG: glycosyltransferase family 39 protein [Patescibacteria group bacterium]
MKQKKLSLVLIVCAIVAIGFFLRIYNIDHTPPGIYPDEAVNGEDAIRSNNTGAYQWYYTANQGREGLFMNLIAFLFKYFGASILTLKFPSIFFGTFTILGTYLLGKELFNSHRTALLAAFFTAVSFWAINFSRISFRANMLPFVLVFAFYFLFKGLRTHRKLDFVLGGLFFGLGVHTYIAFRIAPVILIIMLLVFCFSRKRFLATYWPNILTFIIATLIVASPMLYTFWKHPEFFESRADNVSVFSPKINGGHPWLMLGRGIFLSLEKYNFVGDMNWRHNYPPYPLLDPLTGIAFLTGLVLAVLHLLRRAFHHLKRRPYTDPPIDVHIFLLVWFLVMLAPEFLTAEGLPHALRSIGTQPAVFLLAAAGANFLWERADHKPLRTRQALSWIAVVILLFIGVFNGVKYHYFWARQEKTATSFNKNVTDIAKVLPSWPLSEEKYVVTSYNTLERLPIYVLNEKRPNLTYLYQNELNKVSPQHPENFVVFLTGNYADVISQLQQRFPQLQLQQVSNPPGSIYYILSTSN